MSAGFCDTSWTRQLSIHCAPCYLPPLMNAKHLFSLKMPFIFHHKMINPSLSQIPTSPMKTSVLESLEARLGKWSNRGTKTSHLSLQTSRPPVLTPKAQWQASLTVSWHCKPPRVRLLLDKMQNQRNACHLYRGDGIGYRMLTPEPYVCPVGWAFLLLNLWNLHSGWSHPPLQDLAEMLPVPIHSSTASCDLFSAARTSGSAYFSLFSLSNSDLVTSLSAATNSTLLHWICCPQVSCDPPIQSRSYHECAGIT